MNGNQNLLAEQRRAFILDEVRRRGGVRVNELTRRLNVSDMTVRRDLDALARRGVVEKVHGGAVPVAEARTHGPGPGREPGPDAKEEIARVASAMVAPGSAVAFSGGTTAYAVARRLLGLAGLTVVTNSVRIADAFHSAPAPEPGGGARPGAATVVLTGGVRTPSDALVGPVADRAIGALRFDVLFLGVHGVSAEAGLSTPNLAEAETNRRLIRSARRVVVVADHTKWGRVGLGSFARLEEVDTLVTDAGVPKEVRAAMAEHLPGLVVADREAGAREAVGAGRGRRGGA
ncbi:DeoR/GlpR family DNA-binding transcription regulator [Streptomyces sp. MRC013]|uniref:DeoR/GlpR family DNA-binding transcription regulator n=1 Tax=Streptomyces sp. MRC013 TaxID=2898276 RepID=UPI002026F670|nr:DeoR/GlpR family DNA-binding transcription regulator [Streptomyces sp. MRC013]URM92298.1 DeoR/GlpR family DNA-binding transcription regulator [Streptomyces sp. MRC013]